MNILLQILDDGRLTDNLGRTVSFKNTVIIMTSNVGARQILNKQKLGFSVDLDNQDEYKNLKNDVLKEVRENFRPEFLNRIDEIIVFQRLNKEDIRNIAEIMLNQVSERLKKQNINVSFEKSVEELIIDSLDDINFGARPMRRLIQNLVEDKIVDEYLNGKITENMNVTAFSDFKTIQFK